MCLFGIGQHASEKVLFGSPNIAPDHCIIVNTILEIGFEVQAITPFRSEHNPRSSISPVNIRNVFKWFKPLQNVFKTYLTLILWFSKRFQVKVYAVMFKKRFINILYKNAFTENVY